MSRNETYVRDAELRRLRYSTRDADRKIRKYKDEMRKFEQQVRDEQKRLDLQMRQHATMLQNSVNSFVTRNNNNLAQLSQSRREGISNVCANLDGKFTALEQSLGRARGDFNLINSEFHSLASDYQQLVNALAQEAAGKKERAQLYLNELSDRLMQMASFTLSDSMKNEYDALSVNLNNAKQNFLNGDYDASMLVSQDASTQATILFSQAVAAQRVLAQTKDDGLRNALDLLTRIESMDTRYDNAITVDGEEYSIDYNAYSNGMLAEIRAELEEAKTNLENCNDVAEACTIFETIESIGAQLDACERYAKDEFAKDLICQQTANRVIDILVDSGYENSQNAYVNDDDRDGYMMTFDNNGAQVLVTVRPGQNADQPQFVVESFDDPMENAKNGVMSHLSENGIAFDEVKRDHNCQLYADKDRYCTQIAQESRQNRTTIAEQNCRDVKCGTYN